MTKLNPPKKHQPRPPTLHLDTHQAWWQNEDAVIIPIIYNFLDSMRNAAKGDSLIIPTAAPISLAGSPLNEILSPNEKAGNEFELPERETGESKSQTIGPPENKPFFSVYSATRFVPAKHLSTAVPLLLLGGIALVFVAWMAFR
jgi:hypothetical protein